MDRKEFSIATKRVEWLKAAGTDNAKKVLLKYAETQKPPVKMPRSRCRVCKTTLTWGGGTYHFDHKDNNSGNASQKNCFLVCRNCHGGATKTRVVREREPWFGSVIGYRTQRLKIGYKNTSKRPVRRAVKKPASKTVRKRR